MNPWGRRRYYQNPNFFGPNMGAPRPGFPYQSSPFPFQQHPYFQSMQPYQQFPQQPYSQFQPQAQQPFAPYPNRPNFLAPFKKEDGTIDFKKVGDGVQQVVGVAHQIGPLLKNIGLIK